MTTDRVLFVGGPHAGERGCIEIRDCLEVVQVETPVRDTSPDPWRYNQRLKIWICRYTQRRKFVDDCPTIYAPSTWSNLDVLTELVKGYQV